MLDPVRGWGTLRGLFLPSAFATGGSRVGLPHLRCHCQGWWQLGDKPQPELVQLLLGTATGGCTSLGRGRTGSVAMGQEETGEEEAAVRLSLMSKPQMSQEDPTAARASVLACMVLGPGTTSAWENKQWVGKDAGKAEFRLQGTASYPFCFKL